MKHSIFKQTIAVFFAAIVLASVVAGVFSFWYSSKTTVNSSSKYAHTGAVAVAQMIESVSFDELKESDTTELYVRCRTMMRSICQNLGLEYLYIYEVHPDEQSISFIMTVAADDEQDANVAVKRGLGVVVPRVLTEQEQAALRGEEVTEAYVERNEFGNVYSWYCPIYDNDGNIVALVGSDYSSELLLRQTVHGTLLIILSMIAVLLLVFLIALFAIHRKIFAPIKLITNRMNSFVTDSGANLEPLNINSQDEMQEIADSFEKMSNDISKYLKDIEKLTTERVQKNVELEVAGRIQNGIVPFETRIKEDAYDIYACAKPAKEVGGDFYDCFWNDEGNVCVVIGDVSGKGVAAAMFMVMAKTMLRDSLRSGKSPAETLNYVNDALCNSNPEGMFATVFAAVLDIGSGTFHYANAGHTKPVILGGSAEFLKVNPGIALGLFEDAGIADYSVKFENNSGILIYTDGVTEAVNTQNEFYGEERLLSAVKGKNGAENIVEALSDSVWGFVGGAEQFDDYTVLALHYSGDGGLKPELASLPRLRKIVLDAAGSGKQGKKIYLACEEAFVNIVSYSKATECEVGVKRLDNSLIVTLSDNGVPFNPVSAVAAEKDFEDFDEGGMGISLIRNFAESMGYSRTDNKNILTLCFDLCGEE